MCNNEEAWADMIVILMSTPAAVEYEVVPDPRLTKGRIQLYLMFVTAVLLGRPWFADAWLGSFALSGKTNVGFVMCGVVVLAMSLLWNRYGRNLKEVRREITPKKRPVSQKQQMRLLWRLPRPG